MSRTKKKRSQVNQYIFEDAGPSKAERLANPNSYDARKKKALKDRKKNKSVYEKVQDEARKADEKNSSQGPRGGRLADKIRKLNAEKKDD